MEPVGALLPPAASKISNHTGSDSASTQSVTALPIGTRNAAATTAADSGYSTHITAPTGKSPLVNAWSISGEAVPKPDTATSELACPFRKRNPKRFNIRQFQNCAKNGFGSLATLKRHIIAYHQRPPACFRCHRLFESREAVLQHLRMPADQMCEVVDHPTSYDPEDGITEEVEDMLKERKLDRKVSTWEDLWYALFPDAYYSPSSDFLPPQVVEVWEVSDTINGADISELIGQSRVLSLANCSQYEQALLSQELLAGLTERLTTRLETICNVDDGIPESNCSRRNYTETDFGPNSPTSVTLPLQPISESSEDWPNANTSVPDSGGRVSRGGRRMHSCDSCESSFHSARDLMRHHNSRHKSILSVEDTYTCRCGKHSARKDNFQRHIQNCDRLPLNDFECRCGDTESEKDKFLRHVRECRSSRKRKKLYEL